MAQVDVTVKIKISLRMMVPLKNFTDSLSFFLPLISFKRIKSWKDASHVAKSEVSIQLLAFWKAEQDDLECQVGLCLQQLDDLECQVRLCLQQQDDLECQVRLCLHHCQMTGTVSDPPLQ